MNVDGDEVVFLCARPVPHFLLRFQDTQCGVALQALGGKSCCWNFIFIVWNELHLDLFSVRFCASLTFCCSRCIDTFRTLPQRRIS